MKRKGEATKMRERAITGLFDAYHEQERRTCDGDTKRAVMAALRHYQAIVLDQPYTPEPVTMADVRLVNRQVAVPEDRGEGCRCDPDCVHCAVWRSGKPAPAEQEVGRCDPDCVHCASWRERMARFDAAMALAKPAPPPRPDEEDKP